jgi:hypothetical protein
MERAKSCLMEFCTRGCGRTECFILFDVDACLYCSLVDCLILFNLIFLVLNECVIVIWLLNLGSGGGCEI